MPHIHLETTAGLQENGSVHKILEQLAKHLSTYETIASASVKAYHTQREHWAMGEGATPGFIHCTVSVLSGRPLVLRRAIAEGMYALLREQFRSSVEAGEAAITFELREMDKDTYIK
jgi:5-carboxymethyl-2-hydroxymuconate isomerase